MSEAALDRQREQLISKFAEKKEAAVETGDTAAYRQADKDERAALKDFDDKTAKADEKADNKPGKDGLAPPDRRALDGWMEDNSWFNSSSRLRRAMDDHFADVGNEMPAASMADRLAEARSRVAEEFPAMFGKKPQSNGSRSPVESGSRTSGGKERLASKLPAEAATQADKDIKRGLYKNREEWAAAYYAD